MTEPDDTTIDGEDAKAPSDEDVADEVPGEAEDELPVDEETLAAADAERPEEDAPPTDPKPRGNTAGKDAIVIKALMRDTKAVRMRLDGSSYPAIAKALGYGHRGNAQRAVQRRLKAMREDCGEAAAELRQIECLRLDVALVSIMPKVRDADLQAIDRMLRIQERRAAYEGLDTPRSLKVELTRELEALLDLVRDRCEPDVYEQVLSVLAGGIGSPTADLPPSEEGEIGGGGAGGGTSLT